MGTVNLSYKEMEKAAGAIEIAIYVLGGADAPMEEIMELHDVRRKLITTWKDEDSKEVK